MSTRTYMLAVKSLEPIRQAVGSADKALLSRLLDSLDENYPDFREYAEKLIMGPRPKKEPGCWNYLIEPLAGCLGLEVERLPMDDWKHYAVWREYLTLVNSHISRPAKRLLTVLKDGRPFQGNSVDHDGCMYAWLATEEASQLLNELSAIDTNDWDDLDYFHDELVKSLRYVVDHQMVLFLGAH